MVQFIGKDLVYHCEGLEFNSLYCNLCACLEGQGRQARLKQFGEVSQVSQGKLTPTYLNVFFWTYLDLFTTYLLTYLHINFLNNNSKNDFNLNVNLVQSNGPWSTNQIDNHFVNHNVSQNDKVQIDYLIMLAIQIDLFTQIRWFFLCMFLVCFYQKIQSKKK